MEHVLISMSMESNLLNLFQYGTNILDMLLLGVRVNQNIVEIDNIELIQELMKDVIDISLE